AEHTWDLFAPSLTSSLGLLLICAFFAFFPSFFFQGFSRFFLCFFFTHERISSSMTSLYAAALPERGLFPLRPTGKEAVAVED
ncbi:hypothetical protein, partial [Shewanella algae]|uniref:hypothetical protein n=1 Tax=Shewanella algae TaxID=38313 RepID=UPI001F1DFFCF